MAIAVSGSLTPPSVTTSVAASPEATQPNRKTPAAADADSVRLSQSAQVHLLKQQGQSLSQIASNLSIPLATVDGYLGVLNGVSNSTPVPAK